MIKRAYPTALADEITNMVATLFGRVFSRQVISDVIKDFNPYHTMSYVRTDSDAINADELYRLLWRTQPPLLGHVGLDRYDLIDIDECDLFVTTCNRNYGNVSLGERATEKQKYIKGIKFTLVMGVSALGEVFLKIIPDGNLDADGFLEYLSTNVFPFIAGRVRILMWDNLRAHRTAAVHAAVLAAGHQYLDRPPYTPKWGPIEYGFGVIENHLRKLQFQNVTDINFPQMLMGAIHMATDAQKFDKIFIHSGY
jgi:transposase